jgi:hypothetical protein
MMNISYVNWVTIPRAAELTGYSVASISRKIQTGIWAEGVQWKWADDNRQMINLTEVDKWVERSKSRGSRRGYHRIELPTGELAEAVKVE